MCSSPVLLSTGSDTVRGRPQGRIIRTEALQKRKRKEERRRKEKKKERKRKKKRQKEKKNKDGRVPFGGEGGP